MKTLPAIKNKQTNAPYPTLPYQGRGEGGYSIRRDVLDLMHGRSGRTIDPRIPIKAGATHVGVLPTRQTFLAPSAKRREVSGESNEG